jgi:hypothetical protein
MKRAMWWFAVLVLMAAPAAAQIKTSPLFIIERDTKTNVVHYDARLTADGKLDPKEPVIALLGRACRGRSPGETRLDPEENGLRFYHQAGPVGKRL